MDVTCDRCKAEYEFDETLLGERGTTVKCSACGHVFRVMPPRRDLGRAQLKLRFARDGRTQTLSSLRDLQQRIRAGEVSLDDELGRDGHAYRQLRDVPELRNFFNRTADRTTSRPDAERDPPGWVPGAPAGDDDLGTPLPSPSVGGAGRTMMGVGPKNVAIPRAPRVPDVAQATLGPAAAMARGIEPDVLPSLDLPSDRPNGNATSSTLLGTPARDFGLNGRPAPGGPAFEDDEPAPPAPAPRAHVAPAAIPSSLPPPSAAAAAFAASYAPPARSAAPASLPASATPLRSGRPPERVQLYLEDDDPLPMRTLGRSSRLWIVLLLALLAGGGWIGMNALAGSPLLGDLGKSDATATSAPPTPSAAPTATPTPTESDAATPPAQAAPAAPSAPTSAPQAVAAPAPSKPTASESVDAGRSKTAEKPAKPAAEPAATPASKEPASDKSAHGERASSASKSKPAATPAPAASSSESRSATRERASDDAPDDYGGLVARADQLFGRGDREAAGDAYQRALALRPSGSEANAGLGFVLLARGQARDALPYFDRAAGSGYAEANIGLGDAYRKLGQPSSAVEAYRTYLERLPNGSRAAYARTALEKLGEAPAAGAAEPAPKRGSEPYRPAGELDAPALDVPPSSEKTP